MTRRAGRPAMCLLAWLFLLPASLPAETVVAPAPETEPQDAAAAEEKVRYEVCTSIDDIRDQWSGDIIAEQDRLAALPGTPGSEAIAGLTRALLAEPEFGGSTWRAVPDWQWRFMPRADREEKDDSSWFGWLTHLKDFLDFVGGISRTAGTLGHVVLWLLLLVILVWLWKKRDALLGLLPSQRASSTLIAGIDIAPLLAPDALPDDVVAGAQHLWQSGHERDALSLLYRAALHRLGMQLSFTIPASGTEPECLALVARHADSDTTGAFRTLVNAWMRIAWQHVPPADLSPLVAAYRRTAGTMPAGPAGSSA